MFLYFSTWLYSMLYWFSLLQSFMQWECVLTLSCGFRTSLFMVPVSVWIEVHTLFKTNMSSSLAHITSSVSAVHNKYISSCPLHHFGISNWRLFKPQQMYPTAQHIQSLLSSGHNKYILQPNTYKVWSLQATTIYVLQSWRTYLLWSEDIWNT